MLQRLVIQNFRRFRSIALELDRGMTALSGETGAGKSMLTTAIALALGGRAEADMLAPDQERGEVQCWFQLAQDSEPGRWLDERDYLQELSPQECVLRRVLSRDGRSRAYINGTPVPVGEMGQLGALLMDWVAQHQKHSLQSGAVRLGLLDSAWDSQAALRGTHDAWEQWQLCRQRLEQARGGGEEAPKQLDWLRWQLDEMAKVLPAGGVQELEREHRLLANAAKVREQLAQAAAAMEEGVLPGLAQVRRSLEGLGDLPGLQALQQMLEQGQAPLSDLANELGAAAGSVEEDPQRLAQLDEQLGRLDEMARKHGCAPAELGQAKEALAAQLQELEQASERLPQLEQAEAEAGKAYQEAAQTLRQGRQKHSAAFGERVQGLLRELGMQRAQLACKLDQAEPGPDGIDSCQLTLATAAGEKPRPAHQIASGGELSRLHLALRLCCRGGAQPSLLVLDEIDAGLGGAAGRVLGQRVRELGGSDTQVLCVTHLAVVAACADQQVLVLDSEGEVQVQPLQDKERIGELSRMLTGDPQDLKARETAGDMLRALRRGEKA